MWRYPVGRAGEVGGCSSILFPPPDSPPPTLLQAVERQCKLAHKVVGGGGVIVFHHEPDQHQLRGPQLELQSLPPVGVEAWGTGVAVRVRGSQGPPHPLSGSLTIVEHIVRLPVGTVFGYPIDLHAHQRIHNGVGLLCVQLGQLLGR